MTPSYDPQASYCRGPQTLPLLELTIGECFDQSVQRWPDNLALVSRQQHIRWSYRQLQQRVNNCARALLALGVEVGDRIGIWSPNNAEWCITQLATAKVGAILVTLNPAYRLHEVEYALQQSQCSLVIAADRFKGSNYSAMLQQLVADNDDNPCQSKLPHLRILVSLSDEPDHPGFMSWKQLQELADEVSPTILAKRQASLNCQQAINIQYTSGTTGFPKGATLSHHNILNNGFMVTENLGFSEQDKLVIPVPLYHCFGMVMGNLGCISHGAAMIYPSDAFDPRAVLQTVQEEKATALYGVPTMFIATLAEPSFSDFNLSSLRTGIMAGASCPVEVMKQVMEKMHMQQVQIAYGMTETSPVSTQTQADDPVEKRVSTVGRTHPHLESKIVDPSGDLVTRGQIGELCTKGYSVMLGYWNNDEATQQAIDSDGWMHTGDLACMDDDGYISIVGRSKDMVIRGGENIYPREIEEFLYTHPAVADVQVTGVPDKKYGEELVAWVILKPGEDVSKAELREFCQDQIAHYKIPRYFRFTDEFPMTVTGKIQKFKMREISVEELGLNP
ncbi:AMP-binding protein [Bacterioplanes sanyensis]|uniref:AMP-binding protein n=1 Tax=Bacterioplanes sanyensis TaxID=1249553 RepID=UPI0016796FC0|nr:AMP-binding protein [Bacterioplanes sanyensis]GGY47835.1 AMP-binding protein [Bacterioplanes sanyensis]